jgi:hypothetical protein
MACSLTADAAAARAEEFRELACCPFLSIDVERRDGEVALRIGAPADAGAALDVFYGRAG